MKIVIILVCFCAVRGFLLDNGQGNRRQQADINAMLTEERKLRHQLEQHVTELYQELSATKAMVNNLTTEYSKLKTTFQTGWKNITGCTASKAQSEVIENQCCIETQSLINNVLTLQDNIYGLVELSVQNMESMKCKISSSSWTTVFLACAGNGHSTIGSFKASSADVTTVSGAVTSDQNSCKTNHVRSSMIDDWSKYNIDQVKVELFHNGSSVAVFYFNGLGTSNIDWFSKENLLGTNFIDLKRTSTFNFFSIDGYAPEERRFYINELWHGCPDDVGWLLVRDKGGPAVCHFDHLTTAPTFIVSPNNHKGKWEQGQYVLADVMEISVHTNSCQCPTSSGGSGGTGIIG